MTADLATLTRKAVSGSQQEQPEARNLLLRTIRQLNSIGIYDGSTMKAVYGRRLARVEAEAKRQRALFWARAA